MSDCKHEAFAVRADVTYLDDAHRWTVDIFVNCQQCGEPFRFLGCRPGISLDRVTVNVTGCKLSVPVEPEGTPKLHSHMPIEMPSGVEGEAES